MAVKAESMFPDDIESGGAEQRKPVQLWLDSWLATKDGTTLRILSSKAKSLKPEENDTRKALMGQLEVDHTAHLKTLPKRLHFPKPSRGMVGARSGELMRSKEAKK